MRNAILHRVAPFVVALPLALSVLPSATRAQVVVPPRTPVVTAPKTLPRSKDVPATPAAPAVAPASLTQSFALGTGERTGFGFVVGSPGPIVVNVRWTGAPLIVSLLKPGGVSVDQQGTGSATLQYTATADDVKKGMIWSASVRPAQPAVAPSSAVAVIDKPLKLVVANVATATVSVQYPPGDAKLAQTEVNAKVALALSARPTTQAAASALSSVMAQKQVALQTAQKSQQAAVLVALKSKIPATAFQLSNRVAVEAKVPAGISLANPATKATGTNKQADVSSAGSNAPATVAPDPTIGSLSVASGQPADPVFVTGSSFSEVPGEVHFIVANGKDIAAPLAAWNDTQIIAAVPDVSGLQGYNGFIYVIRGGVKSKMVPFRFNPAMEFRTLGMTNDRNLPGGFAILPPDCVDRYEHFNWFGSRGDDQFFLSTKLMNGWTVSSAYLTGYEGGGVNHDGSADAYVAEFRQGTDSPYVKVHWWKDAFSGVAYRIQVVIIGPKGVPNF